MRGLRKRLGAEEGVGVIEGLLAFGLVVLVWAVGFQALAYAHARSVAIAAAQDGARTAASDGPDAGTARAEELLQAGGSAVASLHAQASEDTTSVTVSVD